LSWFNILKNQFATTADAQFDLDFDNPMVEQEEETCKKQLERLYNSLSNFTAPSEYEEEPAGEPYNLKRFRAKRNITETKLHVRGKNLLEEVPEEVCCQLIELFKNTRDNDGEFIRPENNNGYDLLANKNYAQSYYSSLACDSTYSLWIIKDNKMLYYAEISVVLYNTTNEDIARERLDKAVGNTFDF